MSTRNFFILICLLSCVYTSISAPVDQQLSIIKENENLATNEQKNSETTTATMELNTDTMKIQENEIDSEIVRDEATIPTTIATVEEEEKSTTSPLVPQQPAVMFDPEMMKKQLIERFRKQMTVSAMRTIFLVLNELKRRQNMAQSQQQDVSESKTVELRVPHEGCDCRRNREVNKQNDDDETEIIIIDKTLKGKEMRNMDTYLPKPRNDELNNEIKPLEVVRVRPACESCKIRGIEEMLLKY